MDSVAPPSWLISALKRPGAPSVFVTVELRCTVILSLALTCAIKSLIGVSCGSAKGERVGMRL
ncbi:hypothetical protein THIOM_001286 [Candidatus Thiomargarita nelsonii]|uniref:Uncharacterized protein n=1 Tax=Candidatus Thiomargarita nelsonii TaxID=1003181 RepID=A0A176S4N5_9GAMM|nr:hypothetical protein THIOM_001286 [Candidatus Thiomargarita nelsonii]